MNISTEFSLSALLLMPAIVLAQASQGDMTLSIRGHEGQARVIQSGGRSFVDVESLARITGGTLGFQAGQIVLTLPDASATPPRTPQQEAAKTGYSREFLRAGIEAMSAIREWRSTIENAIRTNNPVDESWVSGYRRSAESGMALAIAAATTDSDRKAVPLLQNELSNMRQWSDRFLNMRKTASYISPDILDNDALDQKILACAQGLAAQAVQGGQFEDVAACH
ncbi:MAG TPA: hypothetical protein VIX42_12320 [Edaphobacter sp.]